MVKTQKQQEETVNINTMGEYAIFKGFLENRIFTYNQILREVNPHKVGKLTFYRKYIQGLLHKIRDFENRHKLPLTKEVNFSANPLNIPDFESES